MKRGIPVLWWPLRRLLLPGVVATVLGRLTFVLAMEGFEDMSALFSDSEDALITFGLIATVLGLAVLPVAYLLRRLDWPAWVRAPLLLLAGGAGGFVLIYILTTETLFANLGIAPAVVSTLVWLFFNLDLLPRKFRRQGY